MDGYISGAGVSMATTKEAAALAMAMEEGKTRDLYNALRTGELGVSLETLAQALYFLQHGEFTLFDVKDAFRSSSGASERFLAYRGFQIVLGKIARVRHYGNCSDVDESVEAASPKHRPRPTELNLMGSLVDQLLFEREHTQLDTLRCQMTRCSALDTLEYNLPLLVQSFQLYGLQNCLSTNVAASMMSTMTLDGFVDFLNAYFEYEEFFSFDDLTRMSAEVLSGFARASAKAESKDCTDLRSGDAMNFAQFMELFCRVASAFHHKLLVREGAQLRRAVESCRLEFSLEVLLDHMSITLIPLDDSTQKTPSNQHQQVDSTVATGVKGLATDSIQSPRGEELAAVVAIAPNIRDVLRLDAADQAISKKPKYRLKRESSLATQGQLSRRPSSTPVEQASLGRSTPSVNTATLQKHSKDRRRPPPQVVMIREVVMPPTLPADVIQLLESALKFQNMAQYNMALSTLDSCRQRYQEQNVAPDDDHIGGVLDPLHTEAQLFFALQAASICDSAHRDAQALTKYYEAMKLARQLPASHPGRLLVKSCVGVTLFYAGELALAQQCHQFVLDARKAVKSSRTGSDGLHQPDKRAVAKTDTTPNCALVDTATAMNNLACCLSQDQSDKSLYSAYLLFKHARQIYTEAFGPAHPRVGLITRNLGRVRSCQSGVVSDASGALARGEYAHVIPGSTFQIQAFEFVAIPMKTSSKSGKSGGKKKKKGAK